MEKKKKLYPIFKDKLALNKRKYIGQKKNSLRIIDFTGQYNVYYFQNGKANYKNYEIVCRCDCGKEHHSRLQAWLSGAAKSCGCLRIAAQRRFKSAEDVSVGRIYNRYKSSAKTRKIEFNITVEEFKKVLIQECFWCGGAPTRLSGLSKDKDKYKDADTVADLFVMGTGVDRVDNMRGYSVDNCAPCCKRCNWMKGDMLREDFIAHATSISEHSKKINLQ